MRYRRIILAATLIAAVAAGPVVLWRKSATNQARRDASRAAILNRRIGPLRMAHAPLRDVFAKLEQLGGVRIDARDSLTGADEIVSVDVPDIALGDAVRLLTVHTLFDYDLVGDTIQVRPHKTMPTTIRIYDVRDLVSAGWSPRSNAEIADAIQLCLDSQCTEEIEPRLDGGLKFISDRLIVRYTSAGHQRIGDFLAAVRRAAPDGSGPTLSGTPFVKEGFWTCEPRIERFYDVRDLAAGAQYTGEMISDAATGQTSVARYTGTAAIVAALFTAADIPEHAGEFLWLDEMIRPIGGRIVVEETAAVHERIRRVLRTLRAGAAIEGLRLATPKGP